MNKYTSSLVLFLLFSTQIMLSQNSVSYSPSATTISANSGVEVLVPITVTCSGNMPTTLVGVQPANTCSTTNGYTGIIYTDNITSLTPGHSTVIKFKFKKTVTADTSITYLFTNNGSCNSPQIKITVNYKYVAPPSCSLPFPPNFNISDIQTNSIKYNWNTVSGASSYIIGYSNNFPNWNYITLSNAQTSYVLTGLLPSTSYDVFVTAVCSNGVWGDTGFGSTSATGSYTTISTLCPSVPLITDFSLTPFSYGYKINFTPIPNFTGNYTLEWVDLVTNSGQVVTNFTLSPAGTTYPDFYYVQSGHNFKIRLIASSSCRSSTSDWLTIIPCQVIVPTNLSIYVTSGVGLFNWTAVTNSTGYRGEYIIYDLSGHTISGTITSTSNSFITSTINTSALSGTKYVKFRMQSKCASGVWSDYSTWSTPSIWN